MTKVIYYLTAAFPDLKIEPTIWHESLGDLGDDVVIQATKEVVKNHASSFPPRIGEIRQKAIEIARRPKPFPKLPGIPVKAEVDGLVNTLTGKRPTTTNCFFCSSEKEGEWDKETIKYITDNFRLCQTHKEWSAQWK